MHEHMGYESMYKPKKKAGCPRSEVTDDCETGLCVCWELNSGPIQEQNPSSQQTLLGVEPCLQHPL